MYSDYFNLSNACIFVQRSYIDNFLIFLILYFLSPGAVYIHYVCQCFMHVG